MTYVAYARNNKTGEKVILGDYSSKEKAWDDIENNVEWEPDDNPADWDFGVEEYPDWD